MTDTKKPAPVETATAPLGRPYAETVSLDVVWAAAFVSAAMTIESPLYRHETESAIATANEIVAALLAAHPRGVR